MSNSHNTFLCCDSFIIIFMYSERRIVHTICTETHVFYVKHTCINEIIAVRVIEHKTCSIHYVN